MDDTERFTLTEQHIELLRAMYVTWISFRGEPEREGAPRIDTKRPYGNSFVLGDIAQILGIEGRWDDDGVTFTLEDEERMWTLHRETETALQVVLATGRFEPGCYERPGYGPWRRVSGLRERFQAENERLRRELEGLARDG